jgi:HAD superfamily hydrolase (TIGR01509 family)
MKPKGCILFDWGDTLMRDFKEYHGPMKAWPRLEAIAGAAEILAALHPNWILALATNAAESDEADIRAALKRVRLDQYLDRVYCYKKIGHSKPSPAFFQYILEDLNLAPESICMVGDNFESDVMGANACGIRAVWFNEYTLEVRQERLQRTIHELRLLPGCLEDFL